MPRIFFLFSLASLWNVSVSLGQDVSGYMPGVVAVQFAPEIAHKAETRTELQEFNHRADQYEMYSLERVYPFLDYVEPTPKTRKNLLALRRTYYMRYHSHTAPEQVADDLDLVQGVVYAEPVVINRMDALRFDETVPNDSKFNDSPHLRHLRLPEAWNIVKGEDGSPRVVIAIVDNGGEWQHEDLLANVWTNPGEVADNGIDDDKNGFVDDVHGVNFRHKTSNDPIANTPANIQHGTSMAGVVGAVTDNGVGISGAAWNADIMHVHAGCVSSNEQAGACFGYEGILYAAANGADIINTSWGSTVSVVSARLMDQTLELATDMGSLIVASTGNDSKNLEYHRRRYPAWHPRVLSVGATERETRKLTWYSNYGTRVDVYAPGTSIYTTLRENIYGHATGTSPAAALVSGVAALIKTKYPDWTPDMIRERIHLTSESIDAENPSYAGILGGGYVNVLSALDESIVVHHQSLRMLYTSTGGDQWKIKSGWDTETMPPIVGHFAQWHGLFVRDEALTQIELSRNNLRGTLPPELGRLSRLRKLSLERNHLTGSIPPAFGKLASLKILHLRGNWLTGLPPEIGNLSNLRILYLGDNQLTTLPLELGKLSNLRVLRLQGNYLTILPSELGNLLNLRDLRLQGNRLTKLPREIGKLANLEYLDLSSNQLSGEVPSELCQLSRLEVLYLGENNLTGSLPRCLMDLQNLTTLSFGISGACAPSDDEFQVWLGSIPSMHGPTCGNGAFSGDMLDHQSYPLMRPVAPLILPKADTGHPPITYTLTPALPSGLSFDSSTRTLSGVPTEAIPATSFTYTAIDAIGEVRGRSAFTIEIYSSVSTEQDALPAEFTVYPSYPSPFQDEASIRFDLPWSAHVEVEVLDMTGRRVFLPPTADLPAGSGHEITLRGMTFPSGAYLYRLTADSSEGRFVHTGNFVRIR